MRLAVEAELEHAPRREPRVGVDGGVRRRGRHAGDDLVADRARRRGPRVGARLAEGRVSPQHRLTAQRGLAPHPARADRGDPSGLAPDQHGRAERRQQAVVEADRGDAVDDVGDDAHRGHEAERCGSRAVARRGPIGVYAVGGHADAYHVKPRLGQRERALRVREVAHLDRQRRGVGARCLEVGELREVGLAARAREVRHEAADARAALRELDRPSDRGRAVAARDAVAPEPGVELQVDRGTRGRGGLELRDRGDRDLDVVRGGAREVGAGRVQPGEDRRVDARRAERERLGEVDDAEHGRAAREHRARRELGPVPVAVGLHDAAHGHADARREHPGVGGDRRRVDLDAHHDSAITVAVAMPASWLIETCRLAAPIARACSAAAPRSSSRGLPSGAWSTT